MRVLIVAAVLVLFPRVAVADADLCPPREPNDSCWESCDLPMNAEQASEAFMAKLRSIKQTRHHINTKLGDALVRRETEFHNAPWRLYPDDVKRWKQNGRWAGPCTGLVAVFVSSAVQDNDTNNTVGLYELRYQTEMMARRVAALLRTSWAWWKHPFISVHSGRSVFVAEGSHRAPSAMKAMYVHLGAKAQEEPRIKGLPLCHADAGHLPIVSEEGLTAYALGFSPSGTVAWLEARVKPGGGVSWGLHVNDLTNDREVARASYAVAKPGPEAFCARHGVAAAKVLDDAHITIDAVSKFDAPAPGADPTAVVIQPRDGSSSDVVMQGREGSKVLSKIPTPAGNTKALGFLRSPYEPRVAVMVVTHDSDGRSALRVLGGRLDTTWLREPRGP